MEARAIQRTVRQSPRKMRLVVDLIRGKNVTEAYAILKFNKKYAAKQIEKTLRSAVANAGQDEEVNLNRLVITKCCADDGPMLNNRLRWRAGPRGGRPGRRACGSSASRRWNGSCTV